MGELAEVSSPSDVPLETYMTRAPRRSCSHTRAFILPSSVGEGPARVRRVDACSTACAQRKGLGAFDVKWDGVQMQLGFNGP